MSKEMINKLIGKLIFAGILILPVLLLACKNEFDAAADGLLGSGTTETAIAVNSGSDSLDEYGTQTNSTSADTLVAEAPEEQSGVESAQGDVDNSTSGNVAITEDAFDSVTVTRLSNLEAEGLATMREEEKLARDVYLTLYEQWGLPLFQNIAGSEQTHMDAVLTLLEQYGLVDPAANHGRGEFTDPVFQSLYDQLVTQGSQSLADALNVGGVIEELDILDLKEGIADSDEQAIVQVYNNLLAGSENHLRAFASTLERQTGESYGATYLSQEAYSAIINGAQARGNGNSAGNRNGRQFGKGGNGN